MAKVIVALTMSLDGFIADRDDGVERIFGWYFDGDTPIRRYREAADRGVPVPPFKLSGSSAGVFSDLVEGGGAVVTGRRTYDISGAWDGNGPLPGLPLFVVTHRVPERVPRGESRYTFVTDGVASAIEQAKAAAGDKYVSLMGSSVPQRGSALRWPCGQTRPSGPSARSGRLGPLRVQPPTVFAGATGRPPADRRRSETRAPCGGLCGVRQI